MELRANIIQAPNTEAFVWVIIKEFACYLLLFILIIFLSETIGQYFDFHPGLMITVLICLCAIFFYFFRNKLFSKTQIAGEIIFKKERIQYRLDGEWIMLDLKQTTELRFNIEGPQVKDGIDLILSSGPVNTFSFVDQRGPKQFLFDGSGETMEETLRFLFKLW